MCGGGGSKKPSTPPAGPVVGYSYAPADNSNTQRQAAAMDPSAGKTATYGSELAAAPAAAPAQTGGM